MLWYSYKIVSLQTRVIASYVLTIEISLYCFLSCTIMERMSLCWQYELCLFEKLYDEVQHHNFCHIFLICNLHKTGFQIMFEPLQLMYIEPLLATSTQIIWKLTIFKRRN